MFAHNCNSLQMYANVCFDYLCHLHSPVIVYAILQQHFRSLVWKALKLHSSNFDQLHKVTPLAGGVAQSALLVEHETPMARAPSHQTPWWANVDPGRLVRFEVFGLRTWSPHSKRIHRKISSLNFFPSHEIKSANLQKFLDAQQLQSTFNPKIMRTSKSGICLADFWLPDSTMKTF